MRLKDRTAVVTGAASGIGAGIAERFISEGARVVIADVNGDAAAALASRLGPQASSVVVDVGNLASVDAMSKHITALIGVPDILVNNAGIGHTPQPLEGLEPEIFDRVFAVNMRSVYLTARAFIPGMRQRKSGAILNIASTAGVSPRPNLTWYNASKGWVITATRSMAVELAKDGIRVNAINPVASETPLLSTFMGQDTPETRARFLSTIPLGRFATPTDMASAAAFLCSDDASMITGVALEVDGGRCI
jgi:3-oxoacyl-[acyl-carrier protein] reductase